MGGENYVFWGGREGYQSLLNTDMERELDHLVCSPILAFLTLKDLLLLTSLVSVGLPWSFHDEVWVFLLTNDFQHLPTGKVLRSCCCLQEEDWIQWYISVLFITQAA